MRKDDPTRAALDAGREAERERPAIDTREGLILTAIVERYIASGDPVASQAIARQQNREGMSAATVRNVMAELSESGYLEQPHTSSGRVPTARAFQFYVEQMLRQTAAPHRTLPRPTQEQIEQTFAGVASATDFFARTSHILALLSGGVGVALTAAGDRELLEHVHFARVGAGRVLTVLVTTSGVVRDRLLTLRNDLTAAELETAGNYLNRNFHGWALDRIRRELAGRMRAERTEYDSILRSLTELWPHGGMEYGDAGGAEAGPEERTGERGAPRKSVFVEGAANLVATEVDRQHLRQILMALEEKRRVIDLLDAYVGGRDTSVRVIVGLEDAMPEMRGLVLVAAPARRGQEHLGTVGVIGPTRMQYASTIGTVTYIADLFGRWAGQG